MTASIGVACITRNRAGSLVRMLLALHAQAKPPDRIVIVDNGSTDDTAERVAAFPGVTRVWAPDAGIAELRQMGAEACGTDIIMMCDDDCEPEPQWVSAVLGAFERGGREIGLVAGRLENHGFQGSQNFKGRGTLARNFSYRLAPDPQQATHFGNANLSVRRDVFERIGGYDLRLRRGMEEIDLVERVRKAGYRLVYEPSAVCHHHNEKSLGHERQPLRVVDTAIASRLYLVFKHQPPEGVWEWITFSAWEARYLVSDIAGGVRLARKYRSLQPVLTRTVPAIVDRAMLPKWMNEAAAVRASERGQPR